MKPTLKIYLISFLATSIPYGVMMYAFEHFENNDNRDHILWQPIISAVLFGLLMSVFFSVMQKRRLKKAGYPKLTDNLLKVKQAKSIETNFTQKEVIDILKDSNKFKKSKIKNLTNSIIIKKKISLFSWGEIITISFDETGNNKIRIESKPSIPTTLIDYGVNIDNVDKVIKIIKTV
jgi:hypothetical protein